MNIFPHELTNRGSWNGKRTINSCYGTVCTILYVLIMVAFVTYYTIPVFKNKQPTISEKMQRSADDEELLYSDMGPLFFSLQTSSLG